MAWQWQDWFGGILTDAAAINSAFNHWITGIGGDIASGLEGGMVALLGDLWDVIVGPVEVIVGVFIIILVLAWALKNELIQLGALATMAVK